MILINIVIIVISEILLTNQIYHYIYLIFLANQMFRKDNLLVIEIQVQQIFLYFANLSILVIVYFLYPLKIIYLKVPLLPYNFILHYSVKSKKLKLIILNPILA
jgi:hypothetical protein